MFVCTYIHIHMYMYIYVYTYMYIHTLCMGNIHTTACERSFIANATIVAVLLVSFLFLPRLNLVAPSRAVLVLSPLRRLTLFLRV